jgi:hypothetical protein
MGSSAFICAPYLAHSQINVKKTNPGADHLSKLIRSVAITKPLLEGPVYVVVIARELKTNKPLVGFWQFNYKKST